MTDDPLRQALYLTGPTASGKTAVGVALAEILGAEVVAMDSMTLYRGMDIGTAKPSVEERRGVPHHLLDLLHPWESASVADYRAWALSAVEAIQARGRRPLFVGGTALYLKTLLRGLFDGPGADPDLRARLEADADRLGGEALHARLVQGDPVSAARLHPADRRRVIRALEVLELTGRPLSDFQTSHDQPDRDARVFALERPRQTLRDRIDRRVVSMFEHGLLAEVRALRSASRPLNPVPSQGVGYREAIDHLDGRSSLAEAVAKTQARTRQFAKRQGTWFRGLAECRPLPVPDDEPPEATARRLAEAIDRPI